MPIKCTYLISSSIPGEYLFTHLFFTKIRLNNPKTNPNCQRKCVFVIVNVQVWIFHKKTKLKQNPAKTSKRVERSQKVKVVVQKVKEMLRNPWESLKYQE